MGNVQSVGAEGHEHPVLVGPSPAQQLGHIVVAGSGDLQGVLDDPGVAVTVRDEERLAIVRHGHGRGFAVVEVVVTWLELDAVVK